MRPPSPQVTDVLVDVHYLSPPTRQLARPPTLVLVFLLSAFLLPTLYLHSTLVLRRESLMKEYVWALHDFIPQISDEVPFAAGERIEVVEKDDLYQDGWWKVSSRRPRFRLSLPPLGSPPAHSPPRPRSIEHRCMRL